MIRGAATGLVFWPVRAVVVRMATNEPWLLWAVRAAGACHFLTLALAVRTPVPPDWDAGLARLSDVHRRFAIAQNAFIGLTMAFLGLVCLLAAPVLVGGEPGGRLLCAALALWWGGRLAVLPWLKVTPQLHTAWLRVGFVLLCVQCALYAGAFGWLAVRGATG